MKPRDLIALVAVAALAVVGVAWFALIAPERKDASRLADSIEMQQGELQAAREQVRGYRAARDAYPANYAAVARLGKALPSGTDVASLIEQLSASSRRTRVSFRSLSAAGGTAAPAAATPGTTADAALPTPKPFEFTFAGRFFRLSRFLRHLERYVRLGDRGLAVDGRLLTIEGFQLGRQEAAASPTASAADLRDISAKVSATSYSVPDLLAGATPDAPAGAPAAATPAAGGTTPPIPPAATIGAQP